MEHTATQWSYVKRSSGSGFAARCIAPNGTLDPDALPGTTIRITTKAGAQHEKVVSEVLEVVQGQDNTSISVALEAAKPKAGSPGWRFVRGEGDVPDAVGYLPQEEAEAIRPGTIITVPVRDKEPFTRTVEQITTCTATEDPALWKVQARLAKGAPREQGVWVYVRGEGITPDAAAILDAAAAQAVAPGSTIRIRPRGKPEQDRRVASVRSRTPEAGAVRVVVILEPESPTG